MAVTMSGFVALVAKLEPRHWDQPTPCTGWSVLDVVDHVVAGDRFTALTLNGSALVAASDASRGLDTQKPNVEEQVKDAAAAVLVAFEGSLDRIIEHRVGPVSARRVLGFRIIDQLGHTWDIAHKRRWLVPRGAHRRATHQLRRSLDRFDHQRAHDRGLVRRRGRRRSGHADGP